MGLQFLEEMVQILLKRGRGSGGDCNSQDISLYESMGRVNMFVMQQAMSPNLQKVEKIEFLLFFFDGFGNIAINFAPVSFLQQFSYLYLLHL